MLIILLCVIILILWIKLKLTHRREFYKKIQNFPGTKRTLPIVGDLHLAFGKSMNEKIKYFIEVIRTYPTTLQVWFGLKVVIVINNPKDIKTVLASPHCTDKSSIYHRTIGGDGLFVANGNKWKNQRRHLNSAFSPRLLNSYTNQFNKFGRNIVAGLKEHAIIGKDFDITTILGIYITDLITRTIYGSTQHKLELSKYCYELVERLMILWGERMLKIYAFILLVLVQKIFGIASEDKKLNKQLRDGLQPILDQKINEYENSVKTLDSDPDSIKTCVSDEHFLEKITRLQFEGAIDISEYRHTSMSMFLAGTETTARSLSIIILMLAIHQEYQQKIYEENCHFLEMYGSNDIDISILSELNLLDRFIKETFRIFPIVPFFGRTPSRDIPITEGIIPAGTDILISVVNINQHPSIWGADATKFNPNNFLPEAVTKRDKCSYLPFSYGPRNCIGYKFAQISTYIGIIYLLKNYQFKTTLKIEDIKFGYGMTASLLNDNLVSIQPRNLNNK